MTIDRDALLAALDEEHFVWVQEHEDAWRPDDAHPGEHGTDYSLHHVDRSASADAEREFFNRVRKAVRSAPHGKI